MVYIDDMNRPYRGMIMCHMISDKREELIKMAKLIGVNPKWIQKAGTYQEHFDVCLEKKRSAIKLGAIPVTQRELVRILVKKKSNKVVC